MLSDPVAMRLLREGEASVAAGDVLDKAGLREVVPKRAHCVATAVVELVTGELAGRWAARRGSYRILYRIDDEMGVITVLAAEHRRDVYRRR